MRFFNYVFVSTLLLSTSALNAGKLEHADEEKIQRKMQKLAGEASNEINGEKCALILEQREHLQTLLELKQKPHKDKETRETLENSTILAYREVKQRRSSTLNAENLEQAGVKTIRKKIDSLKMEWKRKEALREEQDKIISLQIDYLSLLLTLRTNPAKGDPMLQKAYEDSTIQAYREAELRRFSPSYLGNIENTTEGELRNILLRVTTECLNKIHSPWQEDKLICEQREHLVGLLNLKQNPTEDKEEQEALEFSLVLAYNVANEGRYAAYNAAYQDEDPVVSSKQVVPEPQKIEEPKKIEVPKDVPILTTMDYLNFFSGECDDEEGNYGVHPFDVQEGHKGIWQSVSKFMVAFGLKCTDEPIRDYTDSFEATHAAPQLTPTEEEWVKQYSALEKEALKREMSQLEKEALPEKILKEEILKNPFLALTKANPEEYGGRHAVCYYLYHKTELAQEATSEGPAVRKKFEAPLFFVVKK